MAYEDIVIMVLFMGVLMGSMVGAVAVILQRVFHRRRWPIWAPLAVQHGSSEVWEPDNRAKLVTREDGTEAMLLSKEKEKGKNKAIKVPKYADFRTTKKGMTVYPIFKTTTGQYFAMETVNTPTHEGKNLSVVEDKSAKNWAMAETNRLAFAYGPKESMWIRFMPYLMGGMFAGVIIFFIVYYGSVLTNLGNAVSSASSTLAQALTQYQRPP